MRRDSNGRFVGDEPRTIIEMPPIDVQGDIDLESVFAARKRNSFELKFTALVKNCDRLFDGASPAQRLAPPEV